jgi:hypothetical protein
MTLAGFRSRCRIARSCAREVLAVHVLHGKEVAAGHLADVVDAANVRVGDRTRGADFGEETLEQLPVRREAIRQEFQGDGLAELQVVGAVDLSHAAATEKADDPIAVGQNGSRREAARVDRVRGGQTPDWRGRNPARGRGDRRRREAGRQLRVRGRDPSAGATDGRALLQIHPASRAAHGAEILSLEKKGGPKAALVNGKVRDPRACALGMTCRGFARQVTSSSTCPPPPSSRSSRPRTFPT